MLPDGTIKIMFVDDDEEDYLIIQDLLRQSRLGNHSLDWVNSSAKALPTLTNNSHDVYLIDYRLPEVSGVDLIRKAVANGCSSPMIVLTGVSEDGLDMEFLRAGAVDYLIKNQVNPTILEKSIQYAIERKHLEAQLVHAQKMESIGQLAAGVAHEINNPVAFVKSNLHALQRYINTLKTLVENYDTMVSKLSPQQSEEIKQHIDTLETYKTDQKISFILSDLDNLVDESIEGTNRVVDIVNGLRSFARSDEGTFAPIDVNDCIESALKMVWNELKYKASIQKNLNTLPNISGNRNLLGQVFLNILVNASQAIEKDGEIRISSTLNNENIVIKIADTGAGIPTEKIPRIFDPFFTTKPLGQGTGLGLAISYGIIKRHNGLILVDSEENRGTTFTIILPVIPQTSPAGLVSS